ncbi:DUF3348 family protein [Aquincola sp. S2]|uniref:DUF3348 family protein n=1 Tax=Pseudaquabacterium terrae TaxID=2732868 RepID=A0ABX2EG30_9BURK|nr:DUF3348 family protein [Aquabacterium terrae]NRF67579.1 DUF3348 family protein [Aquabacterium terrae]
MAPGLSRTHPTGSTFIRLLADLACAETGDSKQTFAERLSGWLDWTDAIALSAALNGAETPVAAADRPGKGAKTASVFAACKRVRAELVRAITAEGADAETTADLTASRRWYVGHQRTMTERIGVLRADVRQALSNRSPALARLAALDAVFDEALAARERHLLSQVPALLEQRFEQLRSAPDGAATYGRDMQRVLLAELDIRLQPIEGMMEALGQ